MNARICLLSLLLPEAMSCTHLPESGSLRYEQPEPLPLRKQTPSIFFRPPPAASPVPWSDTFRKDAAINLPSPQTSWPSLARPRH
jgi:hypothetical protein